MNVMLINISGIRGRCEKEADLSESQTGQISGFEERSEESTVRNESIEAEFREIGGGSDDQR